MKAAGRRVMRVLYRVADTGPEVDVTNTELMELCGASRRTVEYGVAAAKAAGLIEVTYRPETADRVIHLKARPPASEADLLAATL